MSDFNAIADTSRAFLKILKRNMVPDIIKNEREIVLCSPQDRGDAALTVYLYDMAQNKELSNSAEMVTEGPDKKRYPPEFMTLYYMITAFSSSDVSFRAEEEQKILGRVVQLLKDMCMINGETYQPEMKKSEASISIIPMDMSTEEKMKIWNIPDMSYKASMFYKIDPVAIESNKSEMFTRVKSFRFEVEEKPLDFSDDEGDDDES